MRSELPKQFGFSLPDFKIPHEIQLALINHTKQLYLQGRIPGTSYLSLPETKPFVYSLGLRRAISNGTKVSANMLNRYASDREWQWDYADICEPITDLVKDFIAPVLPYYKMFTRAVVLLQIENETLPLHVDFHDHNIAGHENNKHYSMKFPLTDIIGDNGNPIVELDGEIYQYRTNDSAFLLNEVDIKHGSLGVEHTRGVLFLDGLLDIERIENELKFEPIKLIHFLRN